MNDELRGGTALRRRRALTTTINSRKEMIIMSTTIRHFFVYGSLRPDDDSGQSWTKSAVSNLKAQKAKLLNAKLYQEEYACAVLLDSSSSSPESSGSGCGNNNNNYIMGYVLSTNDEQLFKEKLRLFDEIEGYNSSSSINLYDRTVRDVELIPSTTNVNNSNSDSIQTRESVKAYVYHRTNQCDRKKLIPFGDWLQRER